MTDIEKAYNEPDDSRPPQALHYGYRADRFPKEAGQCRWWLSRGWNGQFDLISWSELELRKSIAAYEKIPVYDYDEMCWDGD